jgi:CHASE3 domain sensor protein
MAQSSNAPESTAFRGAHLGPPLPTATLVAFLIAVLAIVLVAILSYAALQASADSGRRVAHTLQVMEQLQALLSTLQDAETGQRGFLLTGNESYLMPYTNAEAALDGEFKNAHELLSASAEQERRLGTLEGIAAQKMTELEQTVALRRAGDPAAALTMVRTNRGKELMERARATIADMQRDERGTLAARQAQWLNAASTTSGVVLGGSGPRAITARAKPKPGCARARWVSARRSRENSALRPWASAFLNISPVTWTLKSERCSSLKQRISCGA